MKPVSKLTIAVALLFSLTSPVSFADPVNSDINSGDEVTKSQDPAITQTTTTSTTSQTPAATTTTSITSATHAMQSSKMKGLSFVITPDNIQWKDLPSYFPAGGQYAVLEGNPKSRGETTFRIKIPANYQLPPVYAQHIERTTVLSGSINIGLGDNLDTTNGTALPTGSYFVMPANQHHYLWTSEEAILQITGKGPWVLRYVNAKDYTKRHKMNAAPPAETAPEVQTAPAPTSPPPDTGVQSQPKSNNNNADTTNSGITE